MGSTSAQTPHGWEGGCRGGGRTSTGCLGGCQGCGGGVVSPGATRPTGAQAGEGWATRTWDTTVSTHHCHSCVTPCHCHCCVTPCHCHCCVALWHRHHGTAPWHHHTRITPRHPPRAGSATPLAPPNATGHAPAVLTPPPATSTPAALTPPRDTDPAPKDTDPALRGRCFRRRLRPAASDAFSRSRRRGPCQPWRTPAGAARSPSATCSSW